MLLDRGADINAAAYDGQTPFFAACYQGHLEMAKLLHRHGADITQADQDGTFPVHAAACGGHLHIIQFLSQIGVNMEDRGTIYVGAEWNQVLNNATPAMIARHEGYAEIVKFLQATSDVQSASMVGSKRSRSDVPMLERAQKAGVAHRLKPIPQWLHEKNAGWYRGREESSQTRVEEAADSEPAGCCTCRAGSNEANHTCVKPNILRILFGV